MPELLENENSFCNEISELLKQSRNAAYQINSITNAAQQ